MYDVLRKRFAVETVSSSSLVRYQAIECSSVEMEVDLYFLNFEQVPTDTHWCLETLQIDKKHYKRSSYFEIRIRAIVHLVGPKSFANEPWSKTTALSDAV